MEKKKLSLISLIAILIMVLFFGCLCINKKIQNRYSNLDEETLRSAKYEELKDEDTNCEYVKFGAFFAKDTDGDGDANKLLGTCKNIGSSDILYIDLNVLTNGYLTDGKITINGTNFNYSMNMVKDSVLKNNYVSDNVRTIALNKIEAGTQKLILGKVINNLNDNINNYSNVSSITLTGKHVSDSGEETDINKTIDITVDWYGITYTNLYKSNDATTFKYKYGNMESNTISFRFMLEEQKKQLILKENVATVNIPELN